MAFDVYVGTLSRYYSNAWENVAQQMAAQQGIAYHKIHIGGEPEPPPPGNEIRQLVDGWCNTLTASLQPLGVGSLQWDESETQPYLSGRPTWNGYGALLVWAAHAENPDLPLPVYYSDSWADDPAFIRSSDKEFKSRYRTILQPSLWLPVEFAFVFDGRSLSSNECCIGSVYTLKKQLDELYESTKGKLEEQQNAARRMEPEIVEVKKAGFWSRLLFAKPPKPEPAKASLAEMTDFGLTIFRDLAGKACEHKLPMLLDY